MNRFHSLHRLTIVALVLAVGVSCEQPARTTAPGALPESDPAASGRPVDATTYFAHGHLLERQGNFERAAVQYQKALEQRPNFLTARNRLGITLNKLARHAEASAQFSQAIALKPTLAYLHNNLGFSLYLEGQYEAAALAFERALELKPQFPRAHMNYAVVLAKVERMDEAMQELKLACNEEDAYFNMGILLTEAEHYAEAAQYLEAALAMNPKLEVARQQLHEVARLAAAAEARQAAMLAASVEPAEPAELAESAETLNPVCDAMQVASAEDEAELADSADLSPTAAAEPPTVALEDADVDPDPLAAEPVAVVAVPEDSIDPVDEDVEAAELDAGPEPVAAVELELPASAQVETDEVLLLEEPCDDEAEDLGPTAEIAAVPQEQVETIDAESDTQAGPFVPDVPSESDVEKHTIPMLAHFGPRISELENSPPIPQMESSVLDWNVTGEAVQFEPASSALLRSPSDWGEFGQVSFVEPVDDTGAEAYEPLDATTPEPWLMGLFRDAMSAWDAGSPDFEELWCQFEYAFYPETEPPDPANAPF